METVHAHCSRIKQVVRSLPQHNAAVSPYIADSWRRCSDQYRLDTALPGELYVVASPVLRQRQEQAHAIMSAAKTEMATLSRQIAKSNYAIVLTDADGMLLNCLGDPDFIRIASKAGLMPGAVWSERYQGTNGMGTSLALQQPVMVHQGDHYLFCNTGLTCAAAPIFDWQGNVLAVLDASGETNRAPCHILDLVCMSAMDIENQLFIKEFSQYRMVAFHARAEFVGTINKGLVAIDSTSRILAANRNALSYLEATADKIIGKQLNALFDVNFDALVRQRAKNADIPLSIFETSDGRALFATGTLPKIRSDTTLPSLRAGAVADKSHIALNQLQQGDDVVMARNISMALRIAERDVAILLCGETGTGKELFAKAVHLSSKRADQPFVAINCASIPESLIESELFGYKSGAFTGARKDGSSGKLLMANGGTLFLDEIGDMPTALQARLLRVLEEREVTPLGSGASVNLDIRLISATHCNLKNKIAAGEFREDLYYRIQGLTLTLPPLRERTDRRSLIEFVLRQECEDESNNRSNITLEADLMNALEQHPWPGNIRQLRNVLRTMVALRDRDLLTFNDLPADFFVRETEYRSKTHLTESELRLNTLELAERDALIHELKASRWNMSKVARHLKLNRNTLYRKLEKLEINIARKELY